MIVVRINEKALDRVIGAESGNTFIVDHFDGNRVHIRDYRYGVNMTEPNITWIYRDACDVVTEPFPVIPDPPSA